MTEEKKDKNEKAEEIKKETVAPDSVVDKEGKVISGTDNKTNMVLCWIFAPITGLIWMNDADEELRWHAKITLYFGLLSIAVYVIGFVIITLLSVITFGCGSVLYCLFFVWGIVDVVVRIMGAIKAGNGERYEIPVVNDWVK